MTNVTRDGRRKKVVLYARVSTADKGQDPEMQLRELREFCQKQNLEISGEYVDVISSGKVRPQLEKLLGEVQEGKFDSLLCWRYDRVARSALELHTILDKLKTTGIDFVSIKDNVDTGTPAGKLVFGVLASVAEMERAIIRERVCAGLRNAKAKGKNLGRPVTIKLSQKAAQSAVKKHGSIRNAAAALNVSYSSVRNILKEESR